jgi:hypothetical protein
MDKHILFYSNFCSFSKELIGDIMKKNLRDKFVLICVNQMKESLPTFVDRVPMIVTDKKELVYDEMINPFLDSLQPKEVKEEIVPFSTLTARNAFSDTFSFVDDGTVDCGVPTGYVFINDNPTNIPTQQAEEQKQGRFDPKVLENLMSQRDLDVQRVRQMTPRPV